MREKPIPRLRQERERRGWSRNYVAEHIEVDVVTVGRWERGERLPHPVYRQKLCDLFEMTAETLGLYLESSQVQSGEAIDLASASPKEVSSGGHEQQAVVNCADTPETMNEEGDFSQSALPALREITKDKTPRNPRRFSHLTPVPKRGLRAMLAIILLAAFIGSGVLFFPPLLHSVASFHLIYPNGTALSEDCTYRNEGSIAAPLEVANSCSVRVWLFQNDRHLGRALCLNPGMTTGHLKSIWVSFWVSKNSSVC